MNYKDLDGMREQKIYRQCIAFSASYQGTLYPVPFAQKIEVEVYSGSASLLYPILSIISSWLWQRS